MSKNIFNLCDCPGSVAAAAAHGCSVRAEGRSVCPSALQGVQGVLSASRVAG